ncbi:MAG: glycosyltransferase family 1 protein [Xanthobacteraceae bacterium]
MKLLIATDAWHPQVNGVVQTLTMTAAALRDMNVDVRFITPQSFRTVGMPGYPGIRLALPRPSQIARLIEADRPDSIHIATEGPIGLIVRRYCKKHHLPVTTSFHTRFPEYVSARLPIPERAVWAVLRWFHRPSRAVMAATPALALELRARGFGDVVLWPRGVNAALFRPRSMAQKTYPGPVFLSVGRLAVEKNLRAFLSLDLPGTKVVVGDGPERSSLERDYPHAVFLGELFGEALAEIYAIADVFVFPSRTDTFGLVLLEALASGVPVAAFPVTGPRDVIGEAPVGALDPDLRSACLEALTLSRQACRSFALERSWEVSARTFLNNIGDANRETSNQLASDEGRDAEPHLQ